PMPDTLAGPLCYLPNEPVKEELLSGVISRLGLPVVVKECFGSLGKGVYKADTKEELREIAEQVKCKLHLFQKFIAGSAGRDVRVIVIGGKVFSAMLRTSQTDFRSNVELGGKGEKFELGRDGITLCEAVARRLNLDYCGIDLLFGENGFLVCEVNSNAFFGGMERVTGLNVARAYTEHIINEIYGGNV
ncbi:MAG: RimK family alpha-L-glutamate ligase, partial [Clostridia bacterium]|nr:RimK family alpha-L-glutamate ligase [Clostridia bacterium]